MGTTKTDYFREDQNKIAILAKAMGHPARIAEYKSKETVIRSITVYAEKPTNCCDSNTDCC